MIYSAEKGHRSQEGCFTGKPGHQSNGAIKLCDPPFSSVMDFKHNK